MNNLRCRVILLVFFLMLIVGCARTTPKVKYRLEQLANSSEAVVPIFGAKGIFPKMTSKRLINKLQQGQPATNMLERHLTAMQAINNNTLWADNKVTLLVDGAETYTAMFKAIEKAQSSINIESYIIEDDEVGNALADLILKKRAEGVEVNIIYDSLGSLGTSSSFFDHLRDSGINVLEFNPVNPFKARCKGRFSHRDHRKILLVDGKIAITGGINISRVYGSNFLGKKAHHKDADLWRDTDVQIEGPAVLEFQNMFYDTWKKQSGEILVPPYSHEPLRKQGNDIVLVVGNSFGKNNRSTFTTYLSAFISSVSTIYITNSYFVPDKQTVKALIEAAKRGVDVKIILPGKSNISLAFFAGRHLYTRLLKAGVKLYEKQSGMLHAKTAVIDGVWSTVGSTNLDIWSFANNDEVNAVILDRDFARQMERLFEEDLSDSIEIRLDQWRKRSLFKRVKELGSYFIYHL